MNITITSNAVNSNLLILNLLFLLFLSRSDHSEQPMTNSKWQTGTANGKQCTCNWYHTISHPVGTVRIYSVNFKTIWFCLCQFRFEINIGIDSVTLEMTTV